MTAYLQQHHYWMYCILVLTSAFFLTLLIIPSIIYVARARQLYDDANHFRKLHHSKIPRLGGIAIFVSFTITLLLLGTTNGTFPVNYLLTACIILFAIGIKDDLAGVHHSTKFMIEFFVALVLVIPGSVRINNLNGILGLYGLSYFPSVFLSVLTIMFIINAFNLIDGIDGLAATTGILVNGLFSALFFHIDEHEMAVISLSLVGAILGFIRFNLTPAKIFMGDTGSLLIGLVSAVMAIEFIAVGTPDGDLEPELYSALGIATAILIGPISDALRVFILRLSKGKSPFKGDCNHIHHRILRLGFTHLQTTLILVILNGLIILLAFFLADYGSMVMILLIALILILLNWILTCLIRSKEGENCTGRNPFV